MPEPLPQAEKRYCSLTLQLYQGSALEQWRDAFDEMYRFTVIPRRSVERIRRALAEGRDPEPYLEDIEHDLKACVELMKRMEDRPEVCSNCHGSGLAHGIDLATTDGPVVVGAARGTGGRPESECARAPRSFNTTRAALEREIAGALKSCIDAHGPITRERVGSASKRVASVVAR